MQRRIISFRAEIQAAAIARMTEPASEAAMTDMRFLLV
jgi:hypothetical protein